MESKILDYLKRQTEALGFEPETEDFERKLRELKIEMCLSLRTLSDCGECEAVEFCDLIKLNVLDRRIKHERGK